MDDLTVWIPILISTISVIAAIVACIFSGVSTHFSKKQIEEMQKQFLSINRPVLSFEIVYLKRAFLAIRCKNDGNQCACNVKIQIDDHFIKTLPEENFQQLLISNNEKTKNIGIGCEYDIFFGTNKYLKIQSKQPLKITATYSNNDGTTYNDTVVIDMMSQATFFTVNSDMDDLLKIFGDHTAELKRLRQFLENDK